MAMIIEFRGQTPRGETLAEPKGEIIIFPGVRRERHAGCEAAEGEAAETAQKAKRGRKPKRDRIELPE